MISKQPGAFVRELCFSELSISMFMAADVYLCANELVDGPSIQVFIESHAPWLYLELVLGDPLEDPFDV